MNSVRMLRAFASIVPRSMNVGLAVFLLAGGFTLAMASSIDFPGSDFLGPAIVRADHEEDGDGEDDEDGDPQATDNDDEDTDGNANPAGDPQGDGDEDGNGDEDGDEDGDGDEAPVAQAHLVTGLERFEDDGTAVGAVDLKPARHRPALQRRDVDDRHGALELEHR